MRDSRSKEQKQMENMYQKLSTKPFLQWKSQKSQKPENSENLENFKKLHTPKALNTQRNF